MATTQQKQRMLMQTIKKNYPILSPLMRRLPTEMVPLLVIGKVWQQDLAAENTD